MKRYGDRNKDWLREQRPRGPQGRNATKRNGANMDRNTDGLAEGTSWNLSYSLDLRCRQETTCVQYGYLRGGEKQRNGVWVCLWVWHREWGSTAKHLHVWWDTWPLLLTLGLWRKLSYSVLSLSPTRRSSWRTCSTQVTWPTATAELVGSSVNSPTHATKVQIKFTY